MKWFITPPYRCIDMTSLLIVVYFRVRIDLITFRLIHSLASGSISVLSEISGSHGGEYKDGCLLGCCAV
jgi:hypothetical protein